MRLNINNSIQINIFGGNVQILPEVRTAIQVFNQSEERVVQVLSQEDYTEIIDNSNSKK